MSYRPNRPGNNNWRQQNNRPRFSGARKQPKPLDSNLFIKKAEEQLPVAEYVSTHTFADFLISDQLKNNIQQRGYTTPTPIQDQIIPHILQNRDVVGVANTGTGKTAAFLIPLLNKIFYNRFERVLIVAPTRELAMQIQDECKAFSHGMNIQSALLIGGASMYNQIALLKRNPNIVIGTPGRIKELVQTGQLPLAYYNNVVLDEVDRMLDMGFIHDMKFLLAKLPQKRQSLFFSATIPPEVNSIMHMFLKDPVRISVKSQETAVNIDQDIIKMNGRTKIDVLHDLISQEGFGKVLIFGRTKWGVEKLSKMLIQRGFKALAIHGNKSQGQRQRALEQFKKGEIQVLLATDVASRGLDIDDVTHVINYDAPTSYEDYVHRIGRTGRANKKGMAITFVD